MLFKNNDNTDDMIIEMYKNLKKMGKDDEQYAALAQAIANLEASKVEKDKARIELIGKLIDGGVGLGTLALTLTTTCMVLNAQARSLDELLEFERTGSVTSKAFSAGFIPSLPKIGR